MWHKGIDMIAIRNPSATQHTSAYPSISLDTQLPTQRNFGIEYSLSHQEAFIVLSTLMSDTDDNFDFFTHRFDSQILSSDIAQRSRRGSSQTSDASQTSAMARKRRLDRSQRLSQPEGTERSTKRKVYPKVRTGESFSEPHVRSLC